MIKISSPYINRFVQPDTIIPDLSNPQSWNRYSYVRNDPIIFSDPTGHVEETDNDGGCQDLGICRREFFNRRAKEILKALGGKDDLEAMAQITDVGAKLFPDYDDLIPILSDVFLGIEESNPWTLYNAAYHANPCDALGRAVYDCPTNSVSFGDTGFHRDFRDGFSQPFHFWAFFASAANTEGKGPASYIPGRFTGFWGNVYHEILVPDGPGATWQDYALSRAGTNIGTLVNFGIVSPDQLGDAFRNYLGTDGPGAFYVAPIKFVLPLQGNQ